MSDVLVGRLADVAADLSAALTGSLCSADAGKVWVFVAEMLADFGPPCDADDLAAHAADGFVDGWCIYYGDAEKLAAGLGLDDSDADEGLCVLLEGCDNPSFSLIELNHLAWCEAVRSHVYETVIDVCVLLSGREIWDLLGLDADAVAVAARLWADGSDLSLAEIVETASALTV